MWMRCNRGSVRTRQHYVRNVLSLFTHVVQMQAVEQTVHLAWSLVIDTVDVILVRELSNGKGIGRHRYDVAWNSSNSEIPDESESSVGSNPHIHIGYTSDCWRFPTL